MVEFVPPQFGTIESPNWSKSGILGLFLAIAGYWLIVHMPQQYGKPLRPDAVQIVVAPELYRDCEVERSLLVLDRVFRRSGFSFIVSQSTSSLPMTCGEADATIYLIRPKMTGAAASGFYEESKCRITAIAPDNVDFDKRTIAHEFGHHRYGDLGLWKWAAKLLNAPYDYRNDFFIWLHT